jgi:hypothetical protein
MKAFVSAVAMALLLTGCSIKYLQYYRTDSLNTARTDNNFIYENDSLKITYTFWANGGMMSFNIFNKMNKPLYIDWKRSSFIINSNNVYYFNDSIVSSSYNQIYYTTYFNWWNLTYQSRPTASSRVTTHQIATSFLPPQTQVVQSVPYITCSYIKNWGDFEPLYQIRNDTHRKETKIFDKRYSKDNSPIVFRNFLTLSDRQDFQGTFTIDNAFYVAEMQAMDVRNFRHDNGDASWEYYYKKGTDFYLEK